MFRWPAASAFLVALIVTLQAQANTATPLGTVIDPSKGAVPHTTITVRNLKSGQERTVTTKGAGNYTVPKLSFGHYSIGVGATGIAQVTLLNVTLQHGRMTESVTVLGGAVSTNIDAASRAQVGSTQNAARTVELAPKVFF